MITTQSAGPPRVRPRLRRLAIGALIVLLPIALWSAWDYVEARRLARIVDDIRAKEEPVSADRDATARGGPENAARYYEGAAALVDTTGLYDGTALLRRLDFPNGEQIAALVPAIRAWLDQNRDAEALLVRATALDGYWPTTNFSQRTNGLLRLSHLADLRAVERIQAGDPDGAAASVIQQLKIGRLLQIPLNDLGMLTAVGVNGRAASAIPPILELAPSAAVQRSLQAALEAGDRDDLIEHLVVAERAFVLGTYWNSSKRWFAVAPGGIPEPIWLGMRPYMMHLIIEEVQLMTRFLEQSRQPWPERLAVERAEASLEPRQRRTPLSWLAAVHSRWATVNAQQRRTKYAGTMLAAMRSTIVALAVEQYRRGHAGALPARLADLSPLELRAVPIDPFSGAALLYKVLPDGYAVYSVGPNRTDDGGRGAGTQLRRRWGSNQLSEAPLDIGVKVRAPSAGHP
jgi:hypothetical protein